MAVSSALSQLILEATANRDDLLVNKFSFLSPDWLLLPNLADLLVYKFAFLSPDWLLLPNLGDRKINGTNLVGGGGMPEAALRLPFLGFTHDIVGAGISIITS